MASHKASSSRIPYSYQVFLSFRGEDTRYTFVDHLYTALTNAGIRTFRDDDELPRGDNIVYSLEKAIEESRFSIVVLSKNYASSKWCLDELVKILQRKNGSTNGDILPLFYHVPPTEVRHQSGSFAEAFARHEEGGEMEKVERWKAALRQVSDLAGMVILEGQHEAKFIQDVVKEIVTKLNPAVLKVPDLVVGLQSCVRNIDSWVQNRSNAVDVMVIHGIGGLGKTTIAKLVYNRNFNSFEGSSFLANIKDVSEQHNGLVSLQKQLLSNILKGRNEEIHNIDEGTTRITEALSCKRVLLVLDDVDHGDQLDFVVGRRNCCGPGSKIIITTRNKHLPKSCVVCKMYKMPELNVDESLQLFSWHAFGQVHPKKRFLELSKRLVKYCGGVPLALKLIGSTLCGKSEQVWVSELKKLERMGDGEIANKLRISYDGLPDNDIKNVFLHIACFCVGEPKDWTIKVLDSCGLYTTMAIDYLTDRCLLDVTYDGKLTMHQLIRDMGKYIVRQESPLPEKRSRLWDPKDCSSVLRCNIGTNATNSMSFVKHRVVKSNCIPKNPRKRFVEEVCDTPFGLSNKSLKHHGSNFQLRHCMEHNLYQEHFQTNAFTSMKQLKLLRLNYVKLEGSYKEFPKQLGWLCWHGFHLECIPNDLVLESLVVLDMQYSKLTHAWEGYKHLPSLKILNLSHSKWLSETPNFKGATNLERLILKKCVSLVKICESIKYLGQLASLDLSDCTSLKELPSNIGKLRRLESLIILGCSSIREFPKWLVCMDSLREFNAKRTRMLIPPNRRYQQWTLPRFLVDLCLQSCNLTEDCFPSDFCNLPNLECLNLDGNLIKGVPICITTVNKLKTLTMCDCPLLQSVEGLPSTLQTLSVHGSNSLETIRSTSNSLTIHSRGCKNLVEVEGVSKHVGIENVDRRVLKNLGLLDFQLDEQVLKNIKVSYENGIFMTCFGGGEVEESCCDYIDRSGSDTISFTIPADGSNRSIQGLNVCCAYYVDMIGINYFLGERYVIENRTKERSWTYRPSYFSNKARLGKDNKDGIIMLSHWRFGDLLKVGDHLTIQLETFRGQKIKMMGVKVVYQEEEEEEEEKAEDYSEGKNKDVSLSWTEGDEPTYYYEHLRRFSVKSLAKQLLLMKVNNNNTTKFSYL